MRKRFHLLVFAVVITICTNAQLKVHTDGDIGIDVTDPVSKFQVGSTGTSLAEVSIHNASTTTGSRGLAVYQSMTSTNYSYGSVASIIQGSGGSKLVGAYGSAYRGGTPTSARTYGVYGITGNGIISGYNYAVYGYLIGSSNGAGVFGTTNGDVSISGQYAGYFSGNVKVTGNCNVGSLTNPSDINLKKDIRYLDTENVNRLKQLSAIKYKLKHPTEYPDFQISPSDTVTLESLQKDINTPKYTDDRIGLIAQDLIKVFPELVKEDDSGYLGVNYIGLIPVLVEAIKEQQIEIEGLKEDLLEVQVLLDRKE